MKVRVSAARSLSKCQRISDDDREIESLRECEAKKECKEIAVMLIKYPVLREPRGRIVLAIPHEQELGNTAVQVLERYETKDYTWNQRIVGE